MILENPQGATKKLLELINDVSKVAEYTINIQKSVALLYTNNEPSEKEIKKKNTIYNSFKTIKYLGINLTK